MANEQEQRVMLRRYVLGELSEGEAEAVEERYCTDQAYLNELLSVRDDLLTAWTSGELSVAEQQQLTRQWQRLPMLREWTAFSLAWQSLPSTPSWPKRVTVSGLTAGPKTRWNSFSRQKWTLTWATAGAFALICILSGWIFWQRANRDKGSATLVSNVEATPTASVAPTAGLLPPPMITNEQPLRPQMTPKAKGLNEVLGLVLPPLQRDDVRSLPQTPRLVLTNTTRRVQLQLEVTQPVTGPLFLVLQSSVGPSSWRSGPLRVQKQRPFFFVAGEVPTASLVSGPYQVELRSADEQVVAQSAFHLVRP